MIFDEFARKVAANLPFFPNKCQAEALARLASFLLGGAPEGRDRVFVLRGYAGTGKTSLVGALVRTMAELQMPTRLMAPTGRAAKVFASMAGRQALTIHKTIYRQRKFAVEMEGFGLMDNRAVRTLFICDEASMIPTLTERSAFGTGNLLDDLIEFVYSGTDCRLLLVGDVAQLPPVGQTESAALMPARLRSYGLDVVGAELTEVARQQLQSGILYNATLLRAHIATGRVNALPHIIYKEYADVRRVDGETLVDELAGSYAREGLDETILITRSNARANRFNLGIRNTILDREEELSAGDRLLVVRNNYYWGQEFEQLPFVANGDLIVVQRVRYEEELYGFRFAHAVVLLPDYDVETEVILLLDALLAEGPSLTVADRQRLFAAVLADYAHLPAQRDRIRAVKGNPYFNALEVKYGYAVTCHKSQGGQWQDVYLDLGYIHPDHLGLDFYRWLYTAFTRARKTLFLVNASDDMTEDAGKMD